MIKHPRKITILLALAALPAALMGQGQPAPNQAAGAPQTEPSEIIETYGFIVGVQSGIRDFDLTAEEFELFLKGLKRAQSGEAIPANINEIMPQLQAYLGQRQQEVAQEKGATNRRLADEFFNDLQGQEGIQRTPEGVFYKTEERGDGETPDANSLVRIHYEGRLIDGTVFDSSIARGEPAEFPLTGVIEGMRIGISQMQEGGKATLYIPADLAYGDQSQPSIPPGSALIFEVELIEVIDAPAAAPQMMPNFSPPPAP